MTGDGIEDVFSGLGPAEKKAALGRIIAALSGGLDEKEKKELMDSALVSGKDSRRLASMVER